MRPGRQVMVGGRGVAVRVILIISAVEVGVEEGGGGIGLKFGSQG